MYGRILVPVDGSDTALKGLNEAIKIAKTLVRNERSAAVMVPKAAA